MESTTLDAPPRIIAPAWIVSVDGEMFNLTLNQAIRAYQRGEHHEIYLVLGHSEESGVVALAEGLTASEKYLVLQLIRRDIKSFEHVIDVNELLASARNTIDSESTAVSA